MKFSELSLNQQRIIFVDYLRRTWYNITLRTVGGVFSCCRFVCCGWSGSSLNSCFRCWQNNIDNYMHKSRADHRHRFVGDESHLQIDMSVANKKKLLSIFEVCLYNGL